MTPLTTDFIEGLKEDLKGNPIEPELLCSADSGSDKNSQENLWRIWQNTFDKWCMDWNDAGDLAIRFESVLRQCKKIFPDYPVVVKGSHYIQMGLFWIIWHTKPTLLMRFYKLLNSCMEQEIGSDGVEEHYDLIVENREQIISILHLCSNEHLKSGAKLEINKILKAASVEYAPDFLIMTRRWQSYMPEPDTLQGRVEQFLYYRGFSITGGEAVEIPLPDSEPDMEVFLGEMWRGYASETISYVEHLRKVTELDTLRELDLPDHTKEQLCTSCKKVVQFIQHADPVELSSYNRMRFDALLENSPMPSEKAKARGKETEGSPFFKVSKGCRSALWFDGVHRHEFIFSPEQARIVELLLEAFQSQVPDVDQDKLLRDVYPNNANKTFHDIWRKQKREGSKIVYENHPAWKTLVIQQIPRSQTRRLNLQPNIEIIVIN